MPAFGRLTGLPERQLAYQTVLNLPDWNRPISANPDQFRACHKTSPNNPCLAISLSPTPNAMTSSKTRNRNDRAWPSRAMRLKPSPRTKAR
jgi:hypothetical protein